MRRLAILSALVALSACAAAPPMSSPTPAVVIVADATLPPPIAIADQTRLDEAVAIGFETAVAATADLATLAVRQGLIPKARLPRLAELSAQAREAVYAVRAAYDAGNADSYIVAAARAERAISAVRAIVRGGVS